MNIWYTVFFVLLVMGMMTDQLVRTDDVRQYNATVDLVEDKVETILVSSFEFHLNNMGGEPDPTAIGRWPADVQALYDVFYLQSCKPDAQCIPVEKTPWDSEIAIRPFTPVDDTDPLNPIDLPAKLEVSLDTNGATGTLNGDIGLANTLASLYPAGNVVDTTVTFEVGRPGVEIVHDALMPRDGSRGPTANWGFEGFEIADMGDIHFKDYLDSDGNPVSLRDSTFDTISLFGNDDQVNKPTCPSGSEAKVYTAISQLVGKNAKAVKMGSFQSYAIDSGSYWRIKIRYFTQDSAGNGYWEFPQSSESKALVLTRCETI